MDITDTAVKQASAIETVALIYGVPTGEVARRVQEITVTAPGAVSFASALAQVRVGLSREHRNPTDMDKLKDDLARMRELGITR